MTNPSIPTLNALNTLDNPQVQQASVSQNTSGTASTARAIAQGASTNQSQPNISSLLSEIGLGVGADVTTAPIRSIFSFLQVTDANELSLSHKALSDPRLKNEISFTLRPTQEGVESIIAEPTARAGQSLKGRTHLKLPAGINDQQLEGLVDHKLLNSATHLDLEACRQVTDEGLEHLTPLTKLTSLSLGTR